MCCNQNWQVKPEEGRTIEVLVLHWQDRKWKFEQQYSCHVGDMSSDMHEKERHIWLANRLWRKWRPMPIFLEAQGSNFCVHRLLIKGELSLYLEAKILWTGNIDLGTAIRHKSVDLEPRAEGAETWNRTQSLQCVSGIQCTGQIKSTVSMLVEKDRG